LQLLKYLTCDAALRALCFPCHRQRRKYKEVTSIYVVMF
jgi:hypothetical protein